MRLPIAECWIREPDAIPAGAQPFALAPTRERAVDGDEPVGVSIRERVEQDSVDDAVDGGRGADPEREGADGERGVERTATQRARRVADVVEGGLHGSSGQG